MPSKGVLLMSEWMSVGPDGITDIIGEPDEPTIIAFPGLPSEGEGAKGIATKDAPAETTGERYVSTRKTGLTLTPGETLTILDEREEGMLNYAYIKAVTGSTASAGKLAVYLQLDDYAQGGTDSGVKNLTLDKLTDLNFPADIPGMWHLTVDKTDEKVALFRGAEQFPHKKRIRLIVSNTDAAQNLSIDEVEIVRYQNKLLR
tara:strand:+ start:3759 stop:4364 length:606 start_codon:yes stop_codon:yes gene_type:complete